MSVIQLVLLNGIAYGQAIAEQLITLSEFPFPLNEARFSNRILLKLPKLVTLSDGSQ
jgi:hypothetical protein